MNVYCVLKCFCATQEFIEVKSWLMHWQKHINPWLQLAEPDVVGLWQTAQWQGLILWAFKSLAINKSIVSGDTHPLSWWLSSQTQ